MATRAKLRVVSTATKKERVNNSLLLKDTGLRVLHVRPNEGLFGNGLTIAYRPPHKRLVEIAIAICRPSDTFSKKLGTKTAVAQFLAGHTITLPIQSKSRVVDSLIDYFRV